MKPALLKHLLSKEEVERAIVFTRTKHGAERVMKGLRDAGFDCDAIHGDRTQRQRNRALEGFRFGHYQILVATDVAARGIDIDGVTHVFNYELPDDPESYVHRIGRTGRAGAKGIAIAFCDPQERKLLRAVESEIGARVPLADLPPRSPDAVARERAESRGEPAPQKTAPAPASAPSHHANPPAHHHDRSADKRAGAAPVGKPAKKKGYPKSGPVNSKPNKKVRGKKAQPGKGAGKSYQAR
jgi:ATP-dependent RNA helicase RhlE